MGVQEAAGGTDLEGPDVGFIDEEKGTEAMQAGPGRSQVHGQRPRPGWGRGPGTAHTAVLADTLLPPQEPVAVTEEPFTSQLLGNTVEESTRSKELAVSWASSVQAASGKAKPSSQHFKLNRESEMTASLVITPARPPPCSTEHGGRGPQTLGAVGGGHKQLLQASPAPRWHIVTFSRGQHAVHAVGGRCELREAGVPAFQDVGSVNIPATRKRESGPPRTVHLSPWPRCPVSTLDLDRPENEVSEWLSGSPRCQRTRQTASGALAFLAHAGCGPAGVVMQQPLPLP